jgi:hypothetical protein
MRKAARRYWLKAGRWRKFCLNIAIDVPVDVREALNVRSRIHAQRLSATAVTNCEKKRQDQLHE